MPSSTPASKRGLVSVPLFEEASFAVHLGVKRNGDAPVWRDTSWSLKAWFSSSSTWPGRYAGCHTAHLCMCDSDLWNTETDFRWSTLNIWSRHRRVVAKAEHLPKGSNPRFVVTSLTRRSVPARRVYEEIYCAQRAHPDHRSQGMGLPLELLSTRPGFRTGLSEPAQRDTYCEVAGVDVA